MKLENENDSVMQVVDHRMSILRRILNSEAPNNKKLVKAHERKVNKAKIFINELSEVQNEFVQTGILVKIVPIRTFERQLEKADFASLEYDGEFCKVALIQNYPYENLLLIYLGSVDKL